MNEDSCTRGFSLRVQTPGVAIRQKRVRNVNNALKTVTTNISVSSGSKSLKTDTVLVFPHKK